VILGAFLPINARDAAASCSPSPDADISATILRRAHHGCLISGTGLRIFRKEREMTNRITTAAADVRIGDHIYNGPGANAHPTFAWETVTHVDLVDGLIRLTAGRLDHANGEFWFEPEEFVAVIRYPPAELEKAVVKSHNKHGYGHFG